jgi:hypothetical protein
VQHEVHGDSAGNRDDAHEEFKSEAMPDREAVLRNRRTENGVERGFEQRAYCRRWDDADHNTRKNEKLGREAHKEGRLPWGAG